MLVCDSRAYGVCSGHCPCGRETRPHSHEDVHWPSHACDIHWSLWTATHMVCRFYSLCLYNALLAPCMKANAGLTLGSLSLFLWRLFPDSCEDRSRWSDRGLCVSASTLPVRPNELAHTQLILRGLHLLLVNWKYHWNVALWRSRTTRLLASSVVELVIQDVCSNKLVVAGSNSPQKFGQH